MKQANNKKNKTKKSNPPAINDAGRKKQIDEALQRINKEYADVFKKLAES